jgi:drug/metabolite transporter (DMT)-like permease
MGVRTQGSPAPLVGVGLMLLAMAILPGIDVMAKHLGGLGYPVIQIVWARLFFGGLCTLPFALRHGVGSLWPDRPFLQALRGGLLIAATFSFFLAVQYLPIADALAIFFVQPLVLTALSPLVLGERVGPRRWAAVVVGFVGTLIIIRPGIIEVSPGALAALAAGTFLALYFLITRRISGSQPAMVTTFQTNLMGGLIATALVIPVFEWPSWQVWLEFAALGAVANLGHYMIVRAYDFAEASLLAPLAYTEMITSTLLGWIFFQDFPDRWTFVGVAVLISCAVYISMRERALARGVAGRDSV